MKRQRNKTLQFDDLDSGGTYEVFLADGGSFIVHYLDFVRMPRNPEPGEPTYYVMRGTETVPHASPSERPIMLMTDEICGLKEI